MLFGNDRTALRRMYVASWSKQRSGEALEPLERQIAAVVAMHPEYHAMLEQAEAALEQDFTPEGGQSNPFLHMGMHIAIHEQLATQRPVGIVEIYQNLLHRLGDAHEVEHRMLECLGTMLWSAQRNNTVPDERVYLECLRQLI